MGGWATRQRASEQRARVGSAAASRVCAASNHLNDCLPLPAPNALVNASPRDRGLRTAWGTGSAYRISGERGLAGAAARWSTAASSSSSSSSCSTSCGIASSASAAVCPSGTRVTAMMGLPGYWAF